LKIPKQREITKRNIGRVSQLAWKVSRLAIPKVKMATTPIKSENQAAQKLTRMSRTKVSSPKMNNKIFINLLLINIREIIRGKSKAAKIPRELTVPMVLKEVNFANPKGKRNLPKS
ncbi:hypothetical protein GW797_07905, partial [Candidatus Parcubacteria bacterium]|nr:hypothetical protein [Candidatus Parcubacteria bacterium]